MSLTALTVWYEKQASRDQRILRYGAMIAGLMLLALILIPLQNNLGRTRSQLQQQRADLEWMSKQAPTLVAAGPGTPVAANAGRESLAVLIDRSARESGLTKAYTGTQATGGGAMRVQFTNADFNLLLGLLHRLSTQQGLRIEDASFTSSGSPGLVNVSVQLRPGA